MRPTLALSRLPWTLRALLLALAALLLVLLASIASATGLAAQELPAGSASAAARADSAALALIPGDVVRVRVWREPDLSGDFAVDENRTVVLPRLGRIDAGGPPAALRERITRGYTAFLNHASVEVTLLRRVQILGAVRNPGLYPVDATLTLGDAIALAGGTTPQGHPDRVMVMHREGGAAVASRRTLIGDSPLRSGDQLFVPERSWASRNTGVLVGIVSATLGLVATLAR